MTSDFRERYDLSNQDVVNALTECGALIAYHLFGFNPQLVLAMQIYEACSKDIVPNRWCGKPWCFFMRDVGSHSGFVFDSLLPRGELLKGKGEFTYWDEEEIKEYKENANKDYSAFLTYLKDRKRDRALQLLKKIEAKQSRKK